MNRQFNLALISLLIAGAQAFSSFHSQTCRYESQSLRMSADDEPEKKGNFITNFFQELDNFVDDATSRRLGAGQAFYGKRKSSFYGKDDSGKKKNPNKFDPTEDYRGPSSSGYFKWIQDENGNVQPVTRMKEKNVERKMPSFWGSNDE